MNKISLIALMLASASANAQMIEIGNVDAGIKHTTYLNNEGETIGIQVRYTAPNGLIIPTSVELGNDMYQVAVGAGVTVDVIQEILEYSIAGALAKAHFGDSFNLTNDEHIDKFSVILQQEISFRLTKRLNIGIAFNLDMLNWLHVWKAENIQDYGYKPYTYKGEYVTLTSEREYQENIASAKRSSMTSFNITLRYNIFKN